MRGLNIGGGNSHFFSSGNWSILDKIENTYKHNPSGIKYNVDLEQDAIWPVPLMEYDMVYCSHTLEHLTTKAIEHTLSQAYEVMKTGAIIRIVVPDGEVIYNACKTKDKEVIRKTYGVIFINNELPYMFERAAIRTFYSDLLDKWAPAVPNEQLDTKWNHAKWQKVSKDLDSMTMIQFIIKYKKVYEDMSKYGSIRGHRNWFTAERLMSFLVSIGFKEVQQSQESKSNCLNMRDKHFDATWPGTSLFVEAIK